MMKKEKTLRMAVTGALLLTVVAAGISMYRTDTTPKKESKAQQEEESKDVTSKDAEAQDTGELAKNTTENQEATPSPTMNQDNPDNAIPPAQEDENGQETVYAHLQYLFVRPGEVVGAGQIIGTVGQTGRATGVHLHFELWSHGNARDPAEVLDEKLLP